MSLWFPLLVEEVLVLVVVLVTVIVTVAVVLWNWNCESCEVLTCCHWI